MVGDGQVKELRRLLARGKSLAASSRMTEMSEKTARDYRDDDRLPSQRKRARNYRTRIDPFADVWAEVEQRLSQEPRLKACTLFEWLQTSQPGQFPDSTRRTFERRVGRWQGLHGPNKPVMFSQQHHPGRLAASDFTVCNELNVTIGGVKFEHLFFHCVLSYSNVESVSLCFSESFEALSEGIQKAFFEFGGVPQRHRTDSLSAAVKNNSSRKSHTARYAALTDHYGCQPEKTNARCANENGDVESSNGHFKDRLKQALLLRGSRDFTDRDQYVVFAEHVITTSNANRQSRFAEEQAVLGRLPDHRLDTADVLLGVRVGKGSTILVRSNTYSVPSRLIGKQVDVRIEAEHIHVTYQGHPIQTMDRVFGKQAVAINYRHVIDSLVRKPGAFANYRYREEMFPTSQFRIAYDILHQAHSSSVADKQYLKILELAARESQEATNAALRLLVTAGARIDFEVIKLMVQDAANLPSATDVQVEAPDLNEFDCLFTNFDKECQSDEQVKINPGNDGENKFGNDDWGADEQARLVTIESTEVQPALGVDGTVSRVADAELSGSVCTSRNPGGDRGIEPFGLLVGVDDVGMRVAFGRPNQTTLDLLEVTAGQDLGVVRFQSLTAFGEAANGDAQGRFVFGAARECVAVWQTGFGQESCIVCVGSTVDLARTQSLVHDLRDAGSTVVDCQTRSAIAETVPATSPLRRLDHRRLGLCSAEPRGDGSSVHVTGRALRTGQRHAHQQLGVQQVGSNIQGHDDDGSSHRSTGTPQRHHRDERSQLPNRNRQESQAQGLFPRAKQKIINYFNGRSNCR